MPDPLQTAIQAIQAGENAEARNLLATLIRTDPRNERAWLWMSAAVTSDEQRRECLERVLRLNPQNQAALSGLRQLQQSQATVLQATQAQAEVAQLSEQDPAEIGSSAAQSPRTSQPANQCPGALVSTTPTEADKALGPEQPTQDVSQPQDIAVPAATADLQTLKATLLYRTLGKPLLAVVGGAGMTALSFFAAIDAAGGVRPEIRGRYQLLKQVYAWLIITLGPWGVLVVGSLFTCAAVVWLFVRIRTLGPMLRLLDASMPAGETTPSPATATHPVRPEVSSSVAPAPARGRGLRLVVRVLLVLLILGACAFWWVAPRIPQMLYDRERALRTPGTTQIGLMEGGQVLDMSNGGFPSLSFSTRQDQNITLVDLSGNPLHEFPAGLENFHRLEHLYLQGTAITRLPSEIGALTNLRTLSLANSQLVELPPEIGLLQNLETLDLTNNQLRTLPPELAQLPKTTKITVQGNPLRREELPHVLRERLGMP